MLADSARLCGASRPLQGSFARPCFQLRPSCRALTRRRSGAPLPRHTQAVVAAAASKETADIGTLLTDALGKNGGGAASGASTGAAAVQSAGKAARGSGADQAAKSAVQATQQAQQAAQSSAAQNATQAASSAAQSSSAGPSAAEGAKQAASSLQDTAQSTPKVPGAGVDSTKDRLSLALQRANEAPAPPSGAGSAANQAAESGGDAAGGAVQSAQDSAGAVKQSMSDALQRYNTATQRGSPLPDVDAGAGQDIGSQLADTVQSTTAAVQDAASGLVDTVNSATSGLLKSIKGATSGVFSAGGDAASGLGESTSGLRSAADNSLSAVQSTASELLSSASSATSGVQSGVNELLSAVQDQTAGLQASAGQTAASVYDQLPTPAQQALAQAKAFAAQLATEAAANPNTAKLVAVPLLGIPSLLWVASRFNSYGGDLPPQEIFDMLQKEDALLVDIRSVADRTAQGLPDLQRGALGKGATVPLSSLAQFPASKVRRSKDVASDIAALTISRLTKLRKRSTKVIVLDRGDGRAVPIAKRLSKFGVRTAFVVSGGFRRWAQAGLPVTDKKGDYQVSPLQLLGSRSSIAAEETAAVLRQPTFVVLGGAGAVLALFALVDWRHTLQFIGTSGLLLTAALRATSYQQPQDLLDDVSGIANTVTGPLNAISGTTKVLAGKVQSAASSSEGSTESPMLQQAAQPTEPVSAIAAGDAEEVPSRPANSGAGGSDDGRSAAKEAQLPQ